jgi:hypothetical protein
MCTSAVNKGEVVRLGDGDVSGVADGELAA